jgi:hypothetical protein
MELTINQIIGESQLELGLTNDDSSPIMRSWVYEALRTIGLGRTDVIRGDWQLMDNNEFKKPKNMIAPILITLSTDKKCCIYPFIDSSLSKCGCCMNQNGDCKIVGAENKTHFYFSSNNSRYKYYKLDYLAMPTDEDGMPVVEDNMVRAVKQYISYSYKKMKRNIDRTLIPMSEIQEEEGRWIRLMKASRGRKNMPHMMEMHKIGEEYLRSGVDITNFNHRIGIF